MRGKRKRQDIAAFSLHLTDNILVLHQALVNKTYRHGAYQEFKISDPKPRVIHKATVRDRLLHHALYRVLYPYFDRLFISDSYSCRRGKGTHKAINKLREYSRKVSHNNTRTVWILKCDIRKFFASVDHNILKKLIAKKVKDEDINWLINNVIDSFSSEGSLGCGIPLGNLTNQIFSNIYLNELDQFVKHKLKTRYYLRYADDFLILTSEPKRYKDYLNVFKLFLRVNLKLELHPKKISARKLKWGIDFCGYIVLPHYILPRTRTKRRIVKNIRQGSNYQALQSYLGYLSHSSSFKLSEKLKNNYWLTE